MGDTDVGTGESVATIIRVSGSVIAIWTKSVIQATIAGPIGQLDEVSRFSTICQEVVSSTVEGAAE